MMVKCREINIDRGQMAIAKQYLIHSTSMWISIHISKFSLVPDIITSNFRKKASVIEDLYNRFLLARKIRIQGVKKIAITLVEGSSSKQIKPPITGFSPVVNIQLCYDFESFQKMNLNDQNESILTLIHASLQDASRNFAWNFSGFEDIPEAIRKLDFRNCFLIGKMKTSKDKLLKAGVEVDVTTDYAKISMIFHSNDNVLVKRVELIRTHPIRLIFMTLIGKTAWLNDETFEMINKEKDIRFIVSLSDYKPAIHFSSNTKSESQLAAELLALSVYSHKDECIDFFKQTIHRTLNS